MDKLNYILGNTIKKHRINNKITQEQLSLEAGIDRSYISDLENGKRTISIFTLFKICNVFKISPSKLISEVEDCIEGDKYETK